MAILGDLLVQGRSRFLQQIYAPGISIDGDTTVTGTLTLSKIQDAAGTANNSPALIVGGPVTSSHLEFDSNEIMAKATGTTTADLYINTDGGIIFLGKSGVKTQVQGNLQVQGTSTFTGAGTYSGNLTVNGTTSLKGTGITGDLTVSNNAKINGSLIVEDEIRTPKWIVDNIANLGGEFIIAPTIIGGDNVSVNVSDVSNGKYTITVTDSSITSSSFGGIAWSNSSIVKVSGTINDVVLVSVNGTMTQALNTTTNTIQFTVNSSDVTLTTGTYTGNKVKNLHIMMYKNAGIVPVGIFMTSYGESKYPYIDIYSGSSSGSSYSPTTRLGYLTGIKDENGNALTVNGVSPTGWGLYTNNGYFSGTIVSTSGKIGGFTIGTTDIHNGKTSRTETTNNGVWVGTDGIGFGKGITYFSTDGTGKIGPWTLSTTYFRNGSITGATNTSVAGVYLGTDGLNISNGTAATTTYITKTAVNVGNKLTWNGTTLTVTGTVNATAGYFGSSSSNGWQIDSNAIKHGTLGSSGGYILNASGNSTVTINGASRSDLALAIGSKFGVSNDGTLYTNGANITNISAENISTGTISVGVLPESVKNENIEVGGRNLLRNTGKYILWDSSASNATLIRSNDCIKFTPPSSRSWWTIEPHSAYIPIEDWDTTGTYAVSIDVKFDDIKSEFNYPRLAIDTVPNNTTVGYGSRIYEKSLNIVPTTTEWTHFEFAFDGDYTKWSSAGSGTSTYLKVLVWLYLSSSDTSGVSFRNLKLEKGNIATDWTPAPEDLDVHEYITDIDSNNGITIKPINTAGNDYLQINSSAISFYRNNVETLKLEDSTLRVGKLGTNLRNIYITDSEVQIRNNTTAIAKFGSTLTFYEPGTTTVAAEIDSNGINVKVGTFGNATNKITVGTGTSGHSAIRYGMTTLADTTNTGFYIGTDGIALGKGVFKVTAAGALTAKSGSIGKYTITDTYLITGTGTSATGIGGNQAFWAGNGASNSAPFRVSYAGALVSTSATITGTVNATAGYFGSNSTDGWSISSNAITHGTLGSSGGYILNAAGNSSVTINGSSRSNLALAIGSKFGVGNDGTLYANGANITNINASNINAGTLNINYLPESVKNENIEIGGRNLVRGTAFTNSTDLSYWYKNQNPILSVEDESLKIVGNQTSSTPGTYTLVSVDEGSCTVSFWYKAITSGGAILSSIGLWNNTTKVINHDCNITIDDTEWHYYSHTFELTLSQASSINRLYIFLNQANHAVTDGLYINRLKLEKGNIATDWTPAPEDVDTNITNAAKTAANYIYADSNGIKIASANPSTQNQRLELTSSTLKMYDASNYQRLKLDSTNGVIIGKESYGHTQVTDTGLFIYDVNNKKRAQVDNNGLSVYLSDGTTSIANFGEVVRIGPSTGRSRVEVENNTFKLIAYPENQQYVNCSDGRNSSGYCTYNELIPCQGRSGRYPLSFEAVDTSTCTVRIYDDYSEARPLDPLHTHDHEVTNQYTITKATTYIDVTPILGENYGVYVSYRTTDPVAAKHYLFGIPPSTPMIKGGMNVVTGCENAAMGICSFVEGEGNIAGGNYSHAEGHNTQANNEAAHTEGYQTKASGYYSHSEGYGTTASGGIYATENMTEIVGGTHAEGSNTTASGAASHSEGRGTTASGHYSHAEGLNTIASGEASHSEGAGATASGGTSHAEGHSTASGIDAHAEGNGTLASGDESHAQNRYTIASKKAQTALGTFNIEDTATTTTHPSGTTSYGEHALIIGNGTGQANRSNALAVNWNGTIESGIARYGATTWLDILKGNAALYVPKDPDAMSNPVGALVMETAAGGAWVLSNYNDEGFRLVYMTAENRAGGTNTATMPVKINADGSIVTSRDINTTSTSGIFTAGSGITVAVFKFCQRGNVAAFYIGASKSTATAANTVITVGTVAAGRRPPFECAGPGTNGIGDAYINENGVVSFRSTSQIAANARFYARVTYPVV